MKARAISTVTTCLTLLYQTSIFAAGTNAVPNAKRIVFLGDSITYSGLYIDDLEAVLLTKFPNRDFELINVGLPSETVSGLSEPGHAGGKFPRPNLHERLDRVLANLKPDLVVACYGMNDGIYYPFSEERFAAFTNGIVLLRKKVLAAGAQIIHLTPPVFDPVPLKGKTLPEGLREYPQPYEGYDDVLTRYSGWLLAQGKRGWRVIDIHGPMKEFLAKRREDDPKFILASDGVHANATGHALMAEQILRAWKIDDGFAAVQENKPLLGRIRERQNVLTDAWLSEIGHSRPGMSRGLPVDEATARAAELMKRIRKLAEEQPAPAAGGQK